MPSPRSPRSSPLPPLPARCEELSQFWGIREAAAFALSLPEDRPFLAAGICQVFFVLPFRVRSQKHGRNLKPAGGGRRRLVAGVRAQRQYVHLLLRMARVKLEPIDPPWRLDFVVLTRDTKSGAINTRRGDPVGQSHLVLDSAEGALYRDDQCVRAGSWDERIDEREGFVGLFSLL